MVLFFYTSSQAFSTKNHLLFLLIKNSKKKKDIPGVKVQEYTVLYSRMIFGIKKLRVVLKQPIREVSDNFALPPIGIKRVSVNKKIWWAKAKSVQCPSYRKYTYHLLPFTAISKYAIKFMGIFFSYEQAKQPDLAIKHLY